MTTVFEGRMPVHYGQFTVTGMYDDPSSADGLDWDAEHYAHPDLDDTGSNDVGLSDPELDDTQLDGLEMDGVEAGWSDTVELTTQEARGLLEGVVPERFRVEDGETEWHFSVISSGDEVVGGASRPPAGWTPPLVDVEAELAELRRRATDPDSITYVVDEHMEEDPSQAEVFDVVQPGYVPGSRPDLEERLQEIVRAQRLGWRLSESGLARSEAEDEAFFALHDQDEEEDAGLDEAFSGQSNGLCGAAVPHQISLLTGLHTGEVSLRVEVLTEAPSADDDWEDVVEASFSPAAGTRTVILSWEGEEVAELSLPSQKHRVRWSARGMDEASERGEDLEEGAEPLDSYLLQLWPAPASPDAVLKQTSEQAAYWHSAWSDRTDQA